VPITGLDFSKMRNNVTVTILGGLKKRSYNLYQLPFVEVTSNENDVTVTGTIFIFG
jgi:hypothetical protein